MPDQIANEERIRQAADAVAETCDSDVLLLNGPMTRPLDFEVIDLCASRRRKTNVTLLLVTEGGDADPAYRIARCLQEYYDRFSLFVSGYCKSAGTLVALGAHQLIIADHGELGPLDVQMYKEDELGATRSGLTVLSALSTLQTKAYEAFEHFLLETKNRSGGFITTRTAIRVATDLAGSLFAPIYEHVDAMHIGEADRSLKIARRYGELLLESSQNCRPRALETLTSSYPSHGFIIDRHQAKQLFNDVRPPEPEEKKLAECLGGASRDPVPSPRSSLLSFLNSEQNPASSGKDDVQEQLEPSSRGVANGEFEGDSGADAQQAEPAPPARPRAVGKRASG